MAQGLLLKFLQENFTRFATKSPLFFKWWQGISLTLLLITGIPELLETMDVHLPTLFNEKLNKFIAACATGMFWMSMLSAQSTTVASTQSGDILKKTDEKKLPFTATVECKKANKEGGVLNPDTPTQSTVVSSVENKL